MKDIIKQSGCGLTQVSRNKYYIDDGVINLGKIGFLAKLLSTGVFHDYNFDKTLITYIENQEIKSVKSINTLSKGQLTAVLHLLRLNKLEVIELKHTTYVKEHRYAYNLEISGLSDTNNSIMFNSPEDNGWILENAINDYRSDKRNYFSKVHNIQASDTNVNSVVSMINKYIHVIGVNKIEGEGINISVIEGEEIVVAITDSQIVVTELSSDMTSYRVIKELYRLGDVHSNRIVPIIVV